MASVFFKVNTRSNAWADGGVSSSCTNSAINSIVCGGAEMISTFVVGYDVMRMSSRKPAS